MKQFDRKVVLRVAALLIAFSLLVGAAVWLSKPNNDVETAASQLVFVPAKVTAVLSDNAVPDYENSEGRRIGTQELEIRILSGAHKDEILTLTNYMSALFNVDVSEGDRVIVRLITREDGSYYASMFNYDRGLVIGIAPVSYTHLDVYKRQSLASCARNTYAFPDDDEDGEIK